MSDRINIKNYDLSTKTFGTKHIYHVQSVWSTKAKANAEKRFLVSHGKSARVIKSEGIYKVYTY